MWSGGLYGRTLHFGVREHAMGAIMNGIALHSGTRMGPPALDRQSSQAAEKMRQCAALSTAEEAEHPARSGLLSLS